MEILKQRLPGPSRAACGQSVLLIPSSYHSSKGMSRVNYGKAVRKTLPVAGSASGRSRSVRPRCDPQTTSTASHLRPSTSQSREEKVSIRQQAHWKSRKRPHSNRTPHTRCLLHILRMRMAGYGGKDGHVLRGGRGWWKEREGYKVLIDKFRAAGRGKCPSASSFWCPGV